MNKLRRHWKNNGTPFFCQFRFEDNYIFIPERTCQQLDKIMFDSYRNLTCMDVLVDIRHVESCLCSLSESTLIQSIKYELWRIILLVIQFGNLVPSPEDKNVYIVSNSKESLQ